MWSPYVPFVSLCYAVQEDLLNGKEDGEFIKKLTKQITNPTLILWGDHDRVSKKNGVNLSEGAILVSRVHSKGRVL